MNTESELQNNFKKFNKIIIWGLRQKYHTHRYIHKAFYENAKKLGYNVIWVEDEKENANKIKAGDLVISAEVVGRMVPEKIKIEDYNLPIIEGVYYCLHNYKDIFKQNIKKGYLLNLQVYTNEAEKADIKLGPVTYYNSVSRTLYQPWGTNLLSDEFKKPIFRKNKLIFWIGSIWNDKNNAGNINEINQLKMACKKLGLKFIHLRFIPDWLNIFFVRLSRLAPAIGGKQQVDNNYLPCRMFKNISYGQLGITNVKKFKDILGESFVCGETILELLENASKLNQQEFLDLINKQQLIVKNYTYEQSLKNIIDCLGK